MNKTKNITTRICTIVAALLYGTANAGTGMGMDSTDIKPLLELALKPISNANKYIAATYISPPPVNGKCGSDNGAIVYATPTGLCSAGAPSSVLKLGSTYSWSCTGSYGGSNATCSASIDPPKTCWYEDKVAGLIGGSSCKFASDCGPRLSRWDVNKCGVWHLNPQCDGYYYAPLIRCSR